MSAQEQRTPSYDALLIIAQSVCGALERAGVTDCDDPGEAIDVMRENLEAKVSFLESERRRLQEVASDPAATNPPAIGSSVVVGQPPSGGEVDHWEVPPCVECGAVDAKDAETKCICSGDKDDCHGCHLWQDGNTTPPSAPVGEYAQHPEGDGSIVRKSEPLLRLTTDEILAAMNRPSAPVGVEDETIERVLNARVPGGSQVWWSINGGGMKIDISHRVAARRVIEAYIALAQQPAAVDGRIAIEPGERLFQFDSKQQWVNRAQSIWKAHGVRGEDTICVDQRGRLVGWGKHFMDAERDGAYPIVVYRLRADMNPADALAAQPGGAEAPPC